MLFPTSAGLHPVASDTYAYLQPNWSWGRNNCGLIQSNTDRSALLVDTQFTLDLTRRLLATIEDALTGTSIDTVVVTHANGDHCWGTQLLPGAQIIGSADTAEGMRHEIPPAAMTAMIEQTEPTSPLGRYMRKFFADFDFAGIVLTPPTQTFSGEMTLHIGDRPVHLIEVGPAHTDGDVIVHVPDVAAVYAGDIIFIDDHPVMWTGPIRNWITACDRILATGATIIVPGHGPITDPAGVIRFRNYLEHVADYAEAQCSRGVPYEVAAQDIPLAGYEDWGHPERLVVTIGGVYQGLGHGEPGGREVLIGKMTQRYQALVS